MQYQRFHFVYSIKFIQKTLVVCLIPLIKALLDFDLASLYTALGQELALLLSLVLISRLVWRHSGWHLDAQGLTLCTGLVLQKVRTVTPAQIAVVEQRRTVWLRLLGATRVTVYLSTGASLPQASFYLSKEEAARLAEELMPARAATSFFHPTGAQRLSFVMLSANLMTTAVLAWLTLRQTAEIARQLLPANWKALSNLTVQNLNLLERFAEQFLPTGVAWIFTLILVLSCLSLGVSTLRTARFSVSRHGGVIFFSGGLLTLTQRRVRASMVTVCDVRATLAARLLRRYPVFLAAGSYDSGDIPVLVYKRGEEDLLEALMPEFRIPRPEVNHARTQGRSLPAFLALPGGLLLLLWVLFSVSCWSLPELAPVLFLLVMTAVVLFLVQFEGFFVEDAWLSESRVLTVRYARGFTLHSVCVFTPDVSLGTLQTPFSELRGRCTLRLRMPFHRKVRVRSIEVEKVSALPLDF